MTHRALLRGEDFVRIMANIKEGRIEASEEIRNLVPLLIHWCVLRHIKRVNEVTLRQMVTEVLSLFQEHRYAAAYGDRAEKDLISFMQRSGFSTKLTAEKACESLLPILFPPATHLGASRRGEYYPSVV